MFALRRVTSVFSLTITFFAVTVAGCSPAVQAPPTPTAQPSRTVVTISGSGTVTSVLEAMQADFEAAQSEYTLQILPGSGTGGGITGVMDGTLDVAAMARAPKEEETAQGLEFTTLGRAGVSFVVHPEVTVTDLTPEQVRGIFFGEITNWEEVGGDDLPIVVYVRDEGDTATSVLRSNLFEDTEFPETTAAVLTSARDMITSIEGTPGAIGFGTWPGIKAANSTVVPLTVNGFTPEEAEYPYITELGLGHVEARTAVVQPLTEWLATDGAQESLQELGLIPA